MNGRVDFLDWTIKPDQMQTLVPLFGLTFLILFDVALYPLLAKVGVRKPLQKLTLSGVLAVTAFVIAALLQFKIFVRRSPDYFSNSYFIHWFFLGRHLWDTTWTRAPKNLQRIRLQSVRTFEDVTRARSHRLARNDQLYSNGRVTGRRLHHIRIWTWVLICTRELRVWHYSDDNRRKSKCFDFITFSLTALKYQTQY